jgi:hypothetical protein
MTMIEAAVEKLTLGIHIVRRGIVKNTRFATNQILESQEKIKNV